MMYESCVITDVHHEIAQRFSLGEYNFNTGEYGKPLWRRWNPGFAGRGRVCAI
jgi:hypothetical protein